MLAACGEFITARWLLVLLSAVLQILIFPLPDLYFLDWAAVAPLLHCALLRAREPYTLQLLAGVKLLPRKAGDKLFFGLCLGILWYAGNLLLDLQHHAVSTGRGHACPPLGLLFRVLSLRLLLYHGVFGLLISLLASRDAGDGHQSVQPPGLLLAPFAWVAVELARARITGFPWNLLGISQSTISRSRTLPRWTGVYGLSFENHGGQHGPGRRLRASHVERRARQAQAAVAGNSRRHRCAASRQD